MGICELIFLLLNEHLGRDFHFLIHSLSSMERMVLVLTFLLLPLAILASDSSAFEELNRKLEENEVEIARLNEEVKLLSLRLHDKDGGSLHKDVIHHIDDGKKQ